MIVNNIQLPKEPLWTKNYWFICIANFMMSFSFYILMPTLPFYLIDTFSTGKTMVGVVLSIYTIAVLFVRPFSGFLADTFARKPLYIIAYFFFTAIFFGYLVAGSLLLFIILRFIHGLAFGMMSTTGNTLVIDVMPSSRRGEGLGYFGVMGNLAMAIGPMTGLFLIGSLHYSYVFVAALCTGFVGLFFAFMVFPPKKILQKRQAISLDRFFMVKGIPAGITLSLLAIPYGMTNSYIALYVNSLGITASSGFFFSVMALGMILSRISSGKRVDKGFITQNITFGIIIGTCGILCEVFIAQAIHFNHNFGLALYILIAFLIGFGFGTTFPALNTLFVNLAPNNRRATANSTYLTSWDIGIGVGVFLGGALSEASSFTFTYAVGSFFAILSLIFFIKIAIPHFNRNRVR